MGQGRSSRRFGLPREGVLGCHSTKGGDQSFFARTPDLPVFVRPVTFALILALLGVFPVRAQAHERLDLTFPQEVGVTHFGNSWKAPRSGGRLHRGNDLMAPKRTEVYVAADGVVTKVTTSRRAGRYVVVEHADGWETYYMHLNNDLPDEDRGNAPWFLTVAPGIYVGAEVEAGQLLGWVGDSGNAESSSPHTHFELHHHGRAVNPYPYLMDALEKELLELSRLYHPELVNLYID